jgi:tRNA(Ile2) C34 agmatinyltransferase TiaS
MEIKSVTGMVREVKKEVSAKGFETVWIILDEGAGKLLAAKATKKGAANALALKPGTSVELSGVVESREWNGRFFTDFVAFKIREEAF